MKTKINHFVSATIVVAFLGLALASGNAGDVTSGKVEAVAIGEPLKTLYFDVTVNEAATAKRIKFNHSYTNLPEEEGSFYLALNTTFKNTSNESRMIFDGEILVNYNGKEYKFDRSETILEEGWGIFLDQINPLTSKTTNLVYKIPSEISGPAYYRPGRAGSKDLISLGNIQDL
jgi:hypothetical protein